MNPENKKSKVLFKYKNKTFSLTDIILVCILISIFYILLLLKVTYGIKLALFGATTFIFLFLLNAKIREYIYSIFFYLYKKISKKNIILRGVEQEVIKPEDLYILEIQDTFNDVTYLNLIEQYEKAIISGKIAIFVFDSYFDFSKEIKHLESFKASKFMENKIKNLKEINKNKKRCIVFHIKSKEVVRNIKTNNELIPASEQEKKDFQNILLKDAEEKYSYILSKEEKIKTFSIKQFPKNVSIKWLYDFFRIYEMDVSMTIDSLNQNQQRIFFDSQMSFLNNEISKSNYDRELVESNKARVQQALDSVLNGVTSVIKIKTIIKTEEKYFKSIKSILKQKGFIIDELNGFQKEAYLSFYNDVLPVETKWKKYFKTSFEDKVTLVTLSKTFAEGYPIISEEIIEPSGDFIGYDENDNPVIIDQYSVTKNKSSYNSIILGKTGMGKTSFLINNIKDNIIKNNVISFVFDYKDDYKSLFKVFHKDTLNIDISSEDFNINPFMMNDYGLDENFSFTLSFLIILFDSSSEEENAIIKQYIAELYKNKTKNMNVLEKIILKTDSNFKNKHSKIIWSYAKGSESRWFSSKDTKIDLSSYKAVRFDLKSLANRTSPIIASCYYLCFLSLVKEQMNENINKKKFSMLYADEGHFISGNKTSIVLEYLINIAKTARSKKGGVVFSTQNFNDVFKDTNNNNASSIFNNAATHLYFGLGQDDLAKIKSLFDSGESFTDEEIKYITDCSVGKALLIYGKKRALINIKIDEELLKIKDNHDETEAS